MSGSESKEWQGHAGIPLQPTGATLPYPANFPPEYEAQVNENMRNFDKLEGQHNPNSYHQTQKQDRVIILNLRNKIIIALLALLLVGSLIFGIAGAVTHNKAAVCPKRSITEAAETQPVATVTEVILVSATSPPTTSSGSATTRWFTQTKMTTIGASQPSTSAATITTAPAATSSSVNAAALSASLQLVASLKSFESAYLSSLNAATSSFVTRITTIVPSTTTSTTTLSPTSAPTKAASAGGRSNFCGVPGMFCLGG